MAKLRKKPYTALEKACVDAYILGVPFVLIGFHCEAKFPKDFPRKERVRQDGDVIYYKISKRVLLHWLRNNGHTDLTGEKIGSVIGNFNLEMKGLMNELEL